uniref:Glutathione S-transferase n=1 Tax=Tigriopus japonicus TaxID=158387 RepID=B3VHS8_TIGJA|nr:glutathione S-transferase mu5 [Tigriopus japonicus]
MSNPPVLCYWDIRGLAQPIRLLLEYTGTKFEDKQLVCGPGPNYDKSVWTNEKHRLGLDFPNLPYFIDGDRKITQSNAILRYIARKHNLLGQTEEEQMRVDIMAEQSMDFRNGLVRLCYNTKSLTKVRMIIWLPLVSKLDEFAKFLGDRPWFAGESLTFVDFIMYELLDQHRVFAPKSSINPRKLVDYLNRFEKLPPIEAYMKSDRFMKRPLNNRMAKFGAEK